ncbi:MAG: hypothetical protein RIS64_2647 [Bacteroidota bacterium]|jgi:hypothetical protein
MKKYFLFLAIFNLLSCKKNIDTDAIYAQLQDNQTKFVLTLNGEIFYGEDAIFSGFAVARDNFFNMNYFNQDGGNYILIFDGKAWYDEPKIKGFGGGDFSTLMVGKVIDRAKNKGAGYLMTSGNIEPLTISKSKIVFRVSGKMKKYPKMHEEDPAFDFDGYIISKNPKFEEYSIPK